VAAQRWPLLANRLAWWAFLQFYDRMLGSALNPARAGLGLPPVGNVFEHLISPRPLLASDPELVPLPADCPYTAEQIGYFHPHHPGEVPEKVREFIAAGPPPVYLGFGSMTDPDPDSTTRLFVEAIERAGCRALLSRGWAGLGSVPLPGTVQILDSVPHSKLFPRLAGAVHHGGAGTTATAARAGIPQLVVPHIADQFYWGEQVYRRGLGLPPIPRTRLDAESLASALRELTENELLAARARDLGTLLAGRDPLETAPDAILSND